MIRAAFAVLVGSCAFLAVAGPRADLASRSQALHQTLAAQPAVNTAISGQADLSQFLSGLSDPTTGQYAISLTPAQFKESSAQLRDDLVADGLPVAPLSQGWAGLTTKLTGIGSPVPAKATPSGSSVPPRLEVAYRTGLSSFTRLVSGSYPGTTGGTLLQVVATRQTAALLGLHSGSELSADTVTGSVSVLVTGIVQLIGQNSTFWTADSMVAEPALVTTPTRSWWDTGMLTNDAEALRLQATLGSQSPQLSWSFPLDLSDVGAQQVSGLASELGTATAQAPSLRSGLAPATQAVSLTENLTGALTDYLTTETATENLSWLLFVSLTVAAAAVLLLAARLLAARRRDELTVLRARGASAWQVGWIAVRGVALGCVPAAVAGAAIAVAVTSGAGQTPSAGWVLAGIVLLVALVTPAVAAILLTRRVVARRGRARRIVAEVTLTLAAVAGLIVYRRSPADVSGVNPLASAAPVLVAIPVIVIVTWLTPLAVGVVRRLASRRAGAPMLIALARAARPATLTAFAVVLTLTVFAFGGMVRDAITRGEVAVSWQTTGADDAIVAQQSAWFTPSARAAITAVPGVQHQTAVWTTSWALPGNEDATVVAVDPASYAAFTASSPGWPQISAAKLTAAGGAIVSPQVSSDLGGDSGTLQNSLGLPSLTIHVAGTVTQTPALPGNAAFIIVNLAALRDPAAVQPNILLLNGGGIDTLALRSLVASRVPGATVTARSDVLNGLADAPLQRGADVMFLLAVIAAALLAIAALGCELAYGAADREYTLARLAAMGLTARQRIALIAGELAPGLLAAAVAAGVTTIALPRILAPALNLSVFTGSTASVMVTPDATAYVVPLAALVLLAAAATAAGARQRDIGPRLRTGG